ncbi:MAG: prephenate dehydrogenase/arogenate dehydrogenase family protein [Bryobacteraceae bacterium]|nr:prephenate dehydrogenase/arogenate dehydrogenase family protein [Bryobacteraceae bacterium]
MSTPVIAIAGVGLIGGSFGLAMRAAGFTGRLLGVSRPATLEKAIARGAIDAGGTLAEMIPQADVVFLAQPISVILETIGQLGPLLKPGALVTDAGSTKRLIVERAAGLPRFVGGHPMAGKEQQGVESAEEGLFRGRPWILTGDPGAEFTGWLEKIGARIVRLTPEEHDAQVALSSHLPQLLSTALASQLTGQVGTGTAGPGLESMTRLALSSHDLWRDILATNRPAIAAALGQFATVLDEVRGELEHGGLDTRFVKAREFARSIRPK